MDSLPRETMTMVKFHFNVKIDKQFKISMNTKGFAIGKQYCISTPVTSLLSSYY